MSQLEVDKIIPQSGTTLTIGDSGDTISLPSGVSLDTLTITGDLTVDTDSLYVDSANNKVGIGTSSPATKLDIAGNLRLSSANPVIELNNGGPQIYTTVANTLMFATGGGIGTPEERMRIDSSGNVGVGTSSPSTALDVDGTVTATQFVGGGLNAYRNLIINGDMSLAQRGTSVAGITTGYGTVDRFATSVLNPGTWTQSQSTDVPSGQGFANSLKMDCTTANGSLSASSLLTISQRFEGQNLQYLKKGTANAESLTLSFWVKSNKTGTYICELYDNDNTRQFSKSYTIDVANTWEKKTLTYDGDTTGAFDNDNGLSLYCFFYLAAGTNYTSGTLTSWDSATTANRAVGQVNLADSTSNEWYLTGVQLEAGTSASDFEFLPVDVNLQRCQRYYYKAITGTVFNQLAFCKIVTTTAHYAFLQMPVTLRANPSSLDYSGIGLITQWGLGVTSLTSLTFADPAHGTGTTQVLLNAVPTSGIGTAGNISMLVGNNDASGYVALNAEL